mmetsp:Transcript_9996/g.25508  ORF Transcript_9996/g.25508 Transcript_9996/m.25508 type:complete len:688 (-) Transcript_9996:296-2359(-)
MHTFFSSLLGPSDQQAVTRFIRCQQSSVEVPVVRALTELQPRRQLSHIPLKHAVCAPHCHTQYQRRLSLAPMHHRHAVVRGAPPGKVALKPLVSVRSRIVSGGTRRRGELHYGPNLARVHVTKGAAPPLPPPGQRPHKLLPVAPGVPDGEARLPASTPRASALQHRLHKRGGADGEQHPPRRRGAEGGGVVAVGQQRVSASRAAAHQAEVPAPVAVPLEQLQVIPQRGAKAARAVERLARHEPRRRHQRALPEALQVQLLRRERIRPRGVVSGGARRVALEARANNGGLRRRECGRQLGAQPVAVADIIRVLEHEEAAGARPHRSVLGVAATQRRLGIGAADLAPPAWPLRHYGVRPCAQLGGAPVRAGVVPQHRLHLHSGRHDLERNRAQRLVQPLFSVVHGDDDADCHFAASGGARLRLESRRRLGQPCRQLPVPLQAGAVRGQAAVVVRALEAALAADLRGGRLRRHQPATQRGVPSLRRLVQRCVAVAVLRRHAQPARQQICHHLRGRGRGALRGPVDGGAAVLIGVVRPAARRLHEPSHHGKVALPGCPVERSGAIMRGHVGVERHCLHQPPHHRYVPVARGPVQGVAPIARLAHLRAAAALCHQVLAHLKVSAARRPQQRIGAMAVHAGRVPPRGDAGSQPREVAVPGRPHACIEPNRRFFRTACIDLPHHLRQEAVRGGG